MSFIYVSYRVMESVTHFSSFSMWLEFAYTGQKDDLEKFEVSTIPSHLSSSHDSPFHNHSRAQIYRGCIRTADEVLAESPRLQIMRDPPPLIGRRIRYVTVFHFEEEGKPKQSFLRARSWELPKSLEPWKDRPSGWDDVYQMIQMIFGGVDEEDDEDDEDEDNSEEIVVVLPIEALSI